MRVLAGRIYLATGLGVKLFVPMALLMTLAIALFATQGYRAYRKSITQQYIERARGAAALFDHERAELGYSLTDSAELSRNIAHLLDLYPEIFRLTVYVPVGGVYRAVYSNDPSRLGREVQPHDVEPLRTGLYYIHEEVDDGRRVLEVNFPVHQDGRAVATVGAYASLLDRDRQMVVFLRRTVGVVAGTLIALLGVIYLAARSTVVIPLRRVLTTAERVAAGELPAEAPANGDGLSRAGVRDEVARFGLALDATVRRIRRDQLQIRELAITDFLTGLHNRHFFDEIIHREIAQAQRHQQPFAIAVIDVNGLREVNNRFGHLAGDDLLRRAAVFLRRSVRASDEVVRWGGDEFLILMPQTDDAQAAAAARRLKEALAAHDAGSSAAVPLSFSIGVSVWKPGRSLEDILMEADARMYEEKYRSARAVPPSGGRKPGPGDLEALEGT